MKKILSSAGKAVLVAAVVAIISILVVFVLDLVCTRMEAVYFDNYEITVVVENKDEEAYITIYTSEGQRIYPLHSASVADWVSEDEQQVAVERRGEITGYLFGVKLFIRASEELHPKE